MEYSDRLEEDLDISGRVEKLVGLCGLNLIRNAHFTRLGHLLFPYVPFY